MHTKFKLIGLAKGKQKFTLETENEQEIFWSHESHLSNDQYSSLFDLAKNTDRLWEGNNYCVIEHDGYCSDDETPKNPKVIRVILDI